MWKAWSAVNHWWLKVPVWIGLPALCLLSHPAAAQGRPDIVWENVGHYQSSDEVAFSPDGTQILAFDNGGQLRLWQAANGNFVHTLNLPHSASGSQSGITSAFSADRKFLITTDAEGNFNSFNLWRTSDGTLLYSAPASVGNYGIYSIALSPDGNWIAIGGADNTVRLFTAADGILRRTLLGHTNYVAAVTFSPNSQLLASSSQDGTTRIWQVSNGQTLQTLAEAVNTGAYNPDSLRFSPDGQSLALASAKYRISFYRVSDGTLQGTAGPGNLYNVLAFSPDGRTLAAIDYGRIQVFRLSDGMLLQTLTDNNGLTTSVAFSPDGQTLVSGGADVLLWRVSDGTLLRQLTQGNLAPIEFFAFSPDGSMFASNATSHNALGVQRAFDGLLLQTLQINNNSPVNTAAFSPDGQTLAAGTESSLAFWNTADWSSAGTIHYNGRITSVAYSSDEQYLSAAEYSGLIHLYSLPDLTEGDLSFPDVINSIAFSPDGQILAAGAGNGSAIELWDTASGILLQTLNATSKITRIAFSPDGLTLAAAIGDGTSELWCVSDGTLLHTLIGHTDSVNSIAFSPDGLTLATVSYDGTLKIWLAADGSLLRTYDQETGVPFGTVPIGSANYVNFGGSAVAYTPNSKFLAYGTGDGTQALALNPFRVPVFPSHGGNAGHISVKIITPSDINSHAVLDMTAATTVKLSAAGQPDIVGSNVLLVDSHFLKATFDLTNAAPGLYNVVISQPDGTTIALPNAFTVDAGGGPQVFVDILGRSAQRPNKPVTYTIVYGNRGNTDALAVPLWIAGLPPNTPVTLNFSITSPSGMTSYRVVASTPTQSIIPLMLSRIPAGATGTLQVSFTSPPGLNSHFQVQAWTSPAPFNALTPDTTPLYLSCFQSAAQDLVTQVTGNFPYGANVATAAQDALNLITALNNGTVSTDASGNSNLSYPIYSLLQVCEYAAQQVNALDQNALTAAANTTEFNLRLQNSFTQDVVQSQAVTIVSSIDPNDLRGPLSFKDNKGNIYVSAQKAMSYQTSFQNQSKASAPAQQVLVVNNLDPSLDLTTLKVESIHYGSLIFTPGLEYSPPVGTRVYQSEVKLPGTPWNLRVQAALDLSLKTLTWTLTTIDPATEQIPTDPTAGFLPAGAEAQVVFSASVLPGVVSGTALSCGANVTFDNNASLSPPAWNAILDSAPPTSRVTALPATQSQINFLVQWSGQDDAMGSGVRDYTLSVQDNDGPWKVWLQNTTTTQAMFLGTAGHTYHFKSRARDNVQNLEPLHPTADTSTQVTASVPIVLPLPQRPMPMPPPHRPPHRR